MLKSVNVKKNKKNRQSRSKLAGGALKRRTKQSRSNSRSISKSKGINRSRSKSKSRSKKIVRKSNSKRVKKSKKMRGGYSQGHVGALDFYEYPVYKGDHSHHQWGTKDKHTAPNDSKHGHPCYTCRRTAEGTPGGEHEADAGVSLLSGLGELVKGGDSDTWVTQPSLDAGSKGRDRQTIPVDLLKAMANTDEAEKTPLVTRPGGGNALKYFKGIEQSLYDSYIKSQIGNSLFNRLRAGGR